MTVSLDRDRVWQAIDAQRTALAAVLEDLSGDEWQQPSLCPGWTVRDVAAHLTLQQLGPGDVLRTLLKWRGSMDRTIQHVARLRAAELTTGQIVAEIRGTIGSRRRNFGVTHLETLTDILVHSQDIAVPLGRRLDMDPDAAAAAADRNLSMRMPPPPASVRSTAGFRLVATDTTWSAGEGPEVRGPVAALLLVICGRLVALPQLSGEGAAALTARLTATAPTARSEDAS
ncbi:maleylpyruvate isomerase family mycothiol-dependent enzyme [Pseudonocardia sp. C8]|uniref:maleylpyruvate isomerase family mycothiol-dependent enzyme n=1 Tax=Pseudonocardia sp. C8 TaxID=2762759 RepID=UPI001642939E|nr:maleylpyruvate isomerase family mycothiol-dependent enzyme [Pseudonocardia sp. C8]MBC3194171.1 maleylpyruvate isomerase family mycothiol-dependent enzyme [Pseudonocardia sp. C8]